MTEQLKILRVFKLIALLARGNNRTIAELMKHLETSKSTVYKHLNLLELIGYGVEKDFDNRYFIFEAAEQKVFFEEEEALILQQCLSSLPNNSPQKSSILAKIQLGNLLPSATELRQRMYGNFISIIDHAIRDYRWIKLCQYHASDHINIAEDRIVFPISIKSENGLLTAFDHKRQAIRNFKIHRIGKVEGDVTQFSKPDISNIHCMDLFGFTGADAIAVQLLITPRAKNLLEEEYPKSAAYIMPSADPQFPFEYKDEIRNFTGIGRFILGLPGETKYSILQN